MKTSLLVAVSTASLMWGAVAVAQPLEGAPVAAANLTEIRLNQTVEQTLGEGDPRTQGSDAVIYRDFRLSLSQGQSIQVDLTSGDFDAFLEVYKEGGSKTEPLAVDDDGGPIGTNARLRLTADEGGQYVVRVRPFLGLEGGSFRLAVTEQLPRDYPAGPALVMDQAVTGRLDGASPLNDDEARYAPFAWTARAGDRMAIALTSEDFDPVISLGQVRNGRYVELDANDDDERGEGGLNAYLVFTAPSAGSYYIMAKSIEPEPEGAFSLKMEAGPKAAEVRAIQFDQPVEGELTSTTGTGYGNGRADQWRFRGQAGQRISAVLTSDDFDAFVELYDEMGEALASDDDSGGDLNARLVHSLPSTGDYILEARAVGASTGDYELALKVLPPTPAPQALQFGQTLEGELKSSSAIADDGKSYAAYVFDGKEGQRVQFTVRSGDFDAVSQVGKLSDDATPFEALAFDDDGLHQGTDSRLNFTLPEDGRYELRALGLEQDAKGLFSVELIDRGPEPKPGSLLVPSVARGTLTDQDSLNDEGLTYDAYEFRAKADEELRFTLISAAFDAVVEIGETKNDNWRLAASDDDTLSDTHARLDWSAPRDGTYQVRVRGYRPGSAGAYSLIVERQP